MSFNSEFLDRNGYVLPGPSPDGKPADNALLFSIIADLIGFKLAKPIDQMIRDCYLKPGLIGRWPGNDFDQAAWDDYLAVAAWSVTNGEKKIPREILTFGIKNFFIFNTDNKLEGKDFIGRHIHLWPLMIVAAFPFMKYLMYPSLWFCQLFFEKPDLQNTSGIQLQWLYFGACGRLGFKFTKAFEIQTVIEKAFAIYYHTDHPFNKLGD